jgi:hypothetical protein
VDSTGTGMSARVRWLVWTPPWRRAPRDWGRDVCFVAYLGLRAAGRVTTIGLFVAGLLVAVLAGIAAIVAMAADALASAVALLVSAFGHLVLRRPFLVEQVGADRPWRGWWVVGWRRARRVRLAVSRREPFGREAPHVTEVA